MGTTVILVTHKPEDLNYVDSVIFMAEGGHMVYYGNANSHLNYFEVSDTVKVYKNLTKDSAKKWISKFNTDKIPSNPHEQTIKQIRTSSKTNYFSQYWWLTLRYFNIKLNDKLNSVYQPGEVLRSSVVMEDGTVVTPAHKVYKSRIDEFIKFLKECGGFSIW